MSELFYILRSGNIVAWIKDTADNVDKILAHNETKIKAIF